MLQEKARDHAESMTALGSGIRDKTQRITLSAIQTTASMAPVIRVDHSTEQYGVVGMQLLADHFQAEVI